MSQVKLTLRPPPNVDFVHGYPGIPPGAPDRPQAAVKGAVEVRVPSQGVKASWVRIELRKVEMLPGAGQANTFYDFVGPSPVNLWTSSDEYGILKTQDFPFSIRIPESIPPTIALDNRAGISYELVASVCTKGKRGFLRKAKAVVVSTQSSVTIDKHDLHSTWPVYCQPEQRQISQDGVTLTIQRRNTCYGPGDKIIVGAILASDSVHAVRLRGFEMTLKEVTVYRQGHYAAGKKSVPQVRSIIITESKVTVHNTLYGGTNYSTELVCQLSTDHTTTTINAGRHIDVTYTLTVKAVIGTGNPLVMDLPVIISNWPRHVSQEAISRIGPAPSLSLLPPTLTQSVSPTQAFQVDHTPNRTPSTLPHSKPGYWPNDSAYGTNSSQTLPSKASVSDELGYGVGYGSKSPISYQSRSKTDDFGATRNHSATASVSNIASPTARRPNSVAARGTGNLNRLTVTNALPSEIPENVATDSPPPKKPWPTAEEEKLKLYERAREEVQKTQGVPLVPASSSVSAGGPSGSTSAGQGSQPATTPQRVSPNNRPWPSAEKEKEKLFREAQLAVQRNQGGFASPSDSMHNRSTSDLNRAATSQAVTNAQAMYSQAMLARNRSESATQGSSQPSGSSPSFNPPKVLQYLTAEQEKAALRRYEEAKRAVDRVQNTSGYASDEDLGSRSGHAPIAYESLYPTVGSSSSHAMGADKPPPFEAPSASSSQPLTALQEKERMRRAFEAQDILSLQNATPATPPPVSPSKTSFHTQGSGMPPPFSALPNIASSSPPPFGGNATAYANALAEKEALRRKYDAQDAPTSKPPQPPPPRTVSVTGSSVRGSLPKPNPSYTASPSKIITAAEEKALLRAKYDKEDQQQSRSPHQTNGNSGHIAINGLSNGMANTLSRSTSVPSAARSVSQSSSPNLPPMNPPPLMPRPPVEYIQETQEEDARVSRFALNGESPALDDAMPISRATSLRTVPRHHVPGAEMRSYTSFSVDGLPMKAPGPPPPLPPKPAGD